MDIFEKYLHNTKSSWVERALTDKSYKNEYMRIKCKEYNKKTNEDLATYGDAIIKLCYLEIMLDKVDNITKQKEKVESDKFHVQVIARKYNMLDFIRVDSTDEKIIKDYNYNDPGKTTGNNKKNSRHKYIATAVEAMIGAIYKEEKNLKPIIELLKEWYKLGQEKVE